MSTPKFYYKKVISKCELLKFTKYLHIQSTTVYVPSSELGLPQPLCRKRVCLPPRTKGWGGKPAFP